MKPARGLLLFFVCLSLAGCGNPASPLPPSLHLPQPVTNLTAMRTGDRVRLAWTMSTRTTDKLLLKGEQQVQICRGTPESPCVSVEITHRGPGESAQYDDRLPAALLTGPSRLLRYQVRLMNRDSRSAGDSNPAYAAAGQPPPKIADVIAVPTAQGIVVHWTTVGVVQLPAPGAKLFVRLTRERVLRKGESAKPSQQEVNAGVPQPLTQTLEAPEQATAAAGWSPLQVLDPDAELNRVYRYSVQLFEQEPVGGKPEQLAGDAATSLPVSAKNTFAPAAPTGLAAVANPDSGGIDLSWSPGSGAPVAGYIIYRRIVGSAAPPQRVSGAKSVPDPAWSDMALTPGTRYAYSVSAVDASGNESSRSAEADEVAQQKQ